MIKDKKLYLDVLGWLHFAYGDNAEFRDGQYEAIEGVMSQRRTLVVQKTGWGKSLVYFMCTKALREKHLGFTLVISPLLALMENQKEAAEKLDLKCFLFNYTTKNNWDEGLLNLENGLIDVVFITPETLFNNIILQRLPNFQIGLFVIDECHCISEWGHDFRRDYCNLNKVIRTFSENVRILATTATANKQVIEDLEEQLSQGRGKVNVIKGSLSRKSLFIRVFDKWSKSRRYAWILKNLPNMYGTGIIYCRTKFDCEDLSNFLQSNGIDARAYYSGNSAEDEENNNRNLMLFKKNKIKVLVATIKLGMGYDKDDVAFVIHYQMPKSIVEYYQQIGRAGRKIDKAYVVLLTGTEDEEINHYFIETAFPKQEEMEMVYRTIGDNAGITKRGLLEKVNLGFAKVEKVVHFLSTDGYVEETGKNLYQTPKQYVYDKDTYDKIKRCRYNDFIQMQKIILHKGCIENYIMKCLDDDAEQQCGHCFYCRPDLFSNLVEPTLEEVNRAQMIIDKYYDVLPSRQAMKLIDGSKWKTENIICVSRYGEPRFGVMVKEDKYSLVKKFRNELVERGKNILLPFIRDEQLEFLTCVPSLRSELVRDYSLRLAEACGLKFIDCLEKSSFNQQKDMQNSIYQRKNAMDSFSVKHNIVLPKKIILVDDVVDSRWTITACGFKLAEAGCSQVFPFVLANASVGDY